MFPDQLKGGHRAQNGAPNGTFANGLLFRGHVLGASVDLGVPQMYIHHFPITMWKKNRKKQSHHMIRQEAAPSPKRPLEHDGHCPKLPVVHK